MSVDVFYCSVPTEEVARRVTYRWHATGSQFCVAACSVHASVQGVEMNECIVHMRQMPSSRLRGCG